MICQGVASFFGFIFFSKRPRGVALQNPDFAVPALVHFAMDKYAHWSYMAPQGTPRTGEEQDGCIWQRGNQYPFHKFEDNEQDQGRKRRPARGTGQDAGPQSSLQNEPALFWPLPIVEEEQSNSGQK